MFFEICEKNAKYVFSNTDSHQILATPQADTDCYMPWIQLLKFFILHVTTV